MKSLSSALRLLLCFAGQRSDFGVVELADLTGMTKSSVSKMLKAFRDAGLLRQMPNTRRYAVGLRAYALGAQFITQDALAREALPLLRKLAADTGHSARLSVLDGTDIVYLLTIEGAHFMDTGWRVGTYLPPHATVAGKVMLAFLPPEQATAMLGQADLPQLAPHTVTDRTKLRQQLAEIRRKGFGIAVGESAAGLMSIGAPVFGRGLAPLGVLGLASPEHVVARQAIPGLVAALHETARTLSQRMDCQVYPFGHAAAPGRPKRRPAA